ncbi:MAG: SusE domain-containing protein [Flavisolibacter sp.]
MRSIIKFFLLTVSAAVVISSCDKVDTVKQFQKGTAPDLGVNSVNIAPTLADSNNAVLTLKWSDPKYGTDSNHVKFLVEIDSAGRNFSREVTKPVTNALTTSFTGRDINTILLNYGYTLGKAVKLDVRVKSSYSNNNELYTSNIVTISATPYSDPSKLATEKTSVTGTASTSTAHSNTFSWTAAFPGYTGTINYSIQYDSAGKNFVSPQEVSAGTSLSKDMSQDDMNTTALTSGIAIGSTGKVEYRVKAVTAGGAIAYSAPVNVTVATFSPVPANLFIVGDATPGGWANPVPVPSQQFTKVDAYSFSIQLVLTASKSYLFLPVNGDWGHKYGGATDGVSAPGTLLKDGAVPGSNTPAPSTTGVYKIVVNFQTNSYTVTQVAIPANLYIVGDATPGGWSNPVPTPSQQFTKVGPYSFGIIVNLTAGKSYLFLPVNGDWGHKYGGATDGVSAPGNLLADGAVPGSNTPAPATSGLYSIVVNFATSTYTVMPVPTNLYIVGDATAGGWSNPVPTPSQQFTQTSNGVFQLTLPLTGGKSYLFLPVNGDWGHKYGGATDGTSASGSLLLADGNVPGSNTPAPSTTGTYTITVDFNSQTYKVQ